MDAILNVCINTNLNSSCFFWALCWFDAKQFIQHLAGDRVACWLFIRLYCSLHHGTKNLSKNCICPFSFQNICQWKNNDWSSKVLLIQTRRNEQITQQKSRGRVRVMTKHAITGYQQQSSECIYVERTSWEKITRGQFTIAIRESVLQHIRKHAHLTLQETCFSTFLWVHIIIIKRKHILFCGIF